LLNREARVIRKCHFNAARDHSAIPVKRFSSLPFVRALCAFARDCVIHANQ